MSSNWKSQVETVRLVFDRPLSSDRVNAALFFSYEPKAASLQHSAALPNALRELRKRTKEIRGKLPRTIG
jgi:hypothetical protein